MLKHKTINQQINTGWLFIVFTIVYVVHLEATYQPANLNHIIAFGQSNAIGYNASQGAPVSTVQPYENLTFGPLVLRQYYSEGKPVNWTDSSALRFKDFQGSGLRAPYWQVNTVELVSGRRGFWGPDGKRTPHWQHEHYQRQLANVDFRPLAEVYEPLEEPIHSESVITSVCNELTAMTGCRFMGSIAGEGGIKIAKLTANYKGKNSLPDIYPYANTVDLSKLDSSLNGWWGSGAFANVLAQVKRAKKLCEIEDWSYKVPAIIWIQGEADNGDPQGAYSTRLANLASSLNTCIKAITGQMEDIRVFTDGITYNSSYAGREDLLPVDEANLEAHLNMAPIDNHGLVYYSGPRYQYRTQTHYDAQSFYSKGTVFAQAIDEVIFKDKDWEPLRYRNYVVSENSLYLFFHVPTEPIQFDIPRANSVSQNVIGSNEFHGFSVINKTGELIIEDVSITAPNVLRIDCIESPLESIVSYAQKPGKGSLIRGALCDSSIRETIFKGADGKSFETRNWALPFSLKITNQIDLPNLNIGRDFNNMKIHWMTEVEDLVLEISKDLRFDNWQAISGEIKKSKNRYSVNIEFDEKNFYRLRKQ